MKHDNFKDTDSIMTPDPLTLSPNKKIIDALRKMYHAHIRSLPMVVVKGKNRRLIGIVSY